MFSTAMFLKALAIFCCISLFKESTYSTSNYWLSYEFANSFLIEPFGSLCRISNSTVFSTISRFSHQQTRTVNSILYFPRFWVNCFKQSVDRCMCRLCPFSSRAIWQLSFETKQGTWEKSSSFFFSCSLLNMYITSDARFTKCGKAWQSFRKIKTNY